MESKSLTVKEELSKSSILPLRLQEIIMTLPNSLFNSITANLVKSLPRLAVCYFPFKCERAVTDFHMIFYCKGERKCCDLILYKIACCLK